MTSAPTRAVLVATGALLAACGGGSREARPDAGTITTKAPLAEAPRDPALPRAEFRGVIRGIVKLADGASLPLAIDPLSVTGVVQPMAPCAPVSDADRRVVYAAQDSRGLTPIHVAVTGMKSIPPSSPRTHVVHALDCRLQPDLVGAQIGDTVRFENNSAAVLATAFPGQTFLSTLAPGETHDVGITTSGVLLTGCPIGAFCGGTRIVAVAHPLWAVTDQTGSFRIERVPLGEPVQIHAWHPLFNETNLTLTLDASAPERDITLTLTPLGKPEEPAPAPAAKAAKPKPTANEGRRPAPH